MPVHAGTMVRSHRAPRCKRPAGVGGWQQGVLKCPPSPRPLFTLHTVHTALQV